MNKPLKALVIEDSESDALLLLGYLRHGGYEPQFRRVDSATELEDALKQQKWDIVFSDHNMPGFSSTEALEMVRAVNADIPFLIVSGSIGEEVAVAAMKAGAQDYLIKGHLARLVAAVDRELQDAEERRGRRVAERNLLSREEELRIAREIQQQLFPAASPAHAGYDMAGASCPAEATGGDYFDFIAGPHGEIFVVVGDVTGHGLGPALLMTDVRAYLRALVLSNRNLEEIMVQARHLLIEDLGTDRFITLLCAQLITASGTLDYINAGHPVGYVIAPDGHVRGELVAKAPALGIDAENESLVSSRVIIEKGDLVLLLTDGVLETTSPAGEEFGVSRVLEVVRRERHLSSAEIIRVLFDEVRRFSGTNNLQDDITAVVVKCQKPFEVATAGSGMP
ncbi:MAG: SpoIIE family protein phosphatase [bacterium]